MGILGFPNQEQGVAMTSRTPETGNPRLHRYYLAAGATLAATPAAQAAVISFDPLGGLPIIVDTSNTLGDPIDIDLDGNTTADFRLYYSTSYGGGFAIQTLGSNRVMINNQSTFNSATPMRYEYGEVIHTISGVTPLPNARSTNTFNPTFIDNEGFESPLVTPYTVFRARSGYLGLTLMPQAYAGALRVSVNNDGSELTVHGGLYDNAGASLFRLAPLADGFEDPVLNGYFPGPVDKARSDAQGSEASR